MTYVKGESGNLAGRPKGIKNKLPGNAVDIILETAKEQTDKGKGLAWFADKYPEVFWGRIWTRLVPKEIDLSIFGDVQVTHELAPDLRKALISIGNMLVQRKHGGKAELVENVESGEKEKEVEVPGSVKVEIPEQKAFKGTNNEVVPNGVKGSDKGG